MTSLARYWHTLRYLKPVQYYGRLWFRLARPRPDLRAAPALRSRATAWVPCARASSMMGSDRFQFLNKERTLSTAEDWNNAAWPKLWLYNAHYFDDLVATGFKLRGYWHRAILMRWVAENPPGKGNGWEPYPASLRIVNWLKWGAAGNVLDAAVHQSLAVQARWLRKRLEIHLQGNHLWANAKALVFAGAMFEGAEADAWRETGLAILKRELAEQILPDGGHFERSPMYHAIVLEDLLDLVQLAAMHAGLFADNDVGHWRETARKMLRWMRIMSHPDSGIAFFNDAAFGIAPDIAALTAYAAALRLTSDDTPLADIEELPDSGYVRLQAGAAVLIADVGEIGPDYLPGHAHADTLSFELSLYERRVLVNGGTSTYEAGVERLRQRGTAMHNTVQVDGADSSEVWGGFRVARRARPLDVRWGRDAAGLWIEAGHDGYLRLPGRVIHRRRWELSPMRLRISDAVDGQFGEAKANYRFAPGVVANVSSQSGGRTELKECTLQWETRGESGVAIDSTSWHPRFGVDESCQVLVASFTNAILETQFQWS